MANGEWQMADGKWRLGRAEVTGSFLHASGPSEAGPQQGRSSGMAEWKGTWGLGHGKGDRDKGNKSQHMVVDLPRGGLSSMSALAPD